MYRLDFKGKVESKRKPFKFYDPEKKFILKKDKFRENYNHRFSEKSNLFNPIISSSDESK